MSTTIAHADQKNDLHGNDSVKFTEVNMALDLGAIDINEIKPLAHDYPLVSSLDSLSGAADSQDLISNEDESDVTSTKGTEIKDLAPEITAPDHLTENEKIRFYEMAKFCPSTLLNKDCIHYHNCALIQPCRKYSIIRWDNFCHHSYRCHNSHSVAYTCHSVVYNRECVKEDCKHSHDIAVRKAIDSFRASHANGEYGV